MVLRIGVGGSGCIRISRRLRSAVVLVARRPRDILQFPAGFVQYVLIDLNEVTAANAPAAIDDSEIPLKKFFMLNDASGSFSNLTYLAAKNAEKSHGYS